MTKYLVTGAAGFIGSHLVEKLLEGNNTVIGVDNFDKFYSRDIKLENLSKNFENKSFCLIEADLRNKNELQEIFKKHHIDLVIHLAAKAGVRPSILDPVGYYQTNVMGTLNLLEVMKEYDCKKMIFASSSSVYGNNKIVPFSENDSVDNPISPYAATKKAGELLCHSYHHLYGFDIFCLRFFTVYGPRQRPDLAIHKFTKLIMEGKPIPFYGDGSTERDYTYIDDIIDGIAGAINNIKGYDIFNLGESKTISLAQMVAVIENTVGCKAILNRLPLQPGDVERTFANISKAKLKLAYNPKFTFEDGVKQFTEWLFVNK
jgi:UDP-glucuronate 4-epimerase